MMIKQLQKHMITSQMIVSDPYMIKYLIDEFYEVGERLLALIVYRDKEPVLILNKLFKKPKNVHCLHFDDTDSPVQWMLDQLDSTLPLSVDGNMHFRFILPFIEQKFQLSNASPLLESLRRIKSSDEMDKMHKASLDNDRVMALIRNEIKPGISEIELATKVKELHPEGVSFEPIVVFTENIADPHGVPSNRVLTENDVVLVDMGGFIDSYASDMTRAFFVGENKQLESIYQIVLEANKAAISAVKIGQPLSSVDKAARDVITAAGYGDAFIHRTGHGIGIECHENLDVSASNDTLIEIGMCFSIEPGIYIEGLGGIRIEDLVCVRENGVQVLNNYPKEFNDIVITF